MRSLVLRTLSVLVAAGIGASVAATPAAKASSTAFNSGSAIVLRLAPRSTGTGFNDGGAARGRGTGTSPWRNCTLATAA